MTPGSGIGIVPQADAAQRCGTMLVWERTEADGMAAALRPYTGYHRCGVDLLFVAEDRGLHAIYGEIAARPLDEMKAALRRGDLCMFVTKRRDDLTDAGWDELLETLGRAIWVFADDLQQSIGCAGTRLQRMWLPLVRSTEQHMLRMRRAGAG